MKLQYKVCLYLQKIQDFNRYEYIDWIGDDDINIKENKIK